MTSKRYTKDDVRTVLNWLGFECNVGNFRKLDPIMDWAATAKQIERPTRHALCHILDGCGRVVTDMGKPVVVLEEVEAQTEAEAQEILRKQSKQFVKWWMEPRSVSADFAPTQENLS